jgi:hypothetical protein
MIQEELLFAGRGNGKAIRRQISAELTRVVAEQIVKNLREPAAEKPRATTEP